MTTKMPLRPILLHKDHAGLDALFLANAKPITPDKSMENIMFDAGVQHVIKVLKDKCTATKLHPQYS